jgi:Arc/MetJ-type ribon-helix-helix transcriptional regulator
MKVSVSLPEADVAYLDAYARSQGLDSRSAVLHQAIRLLRANELSDAYEDAWQDWDSEADAELWNTTTIDGLAS